MGVAVAMSCMCDRQESVGDHRLHKAIEMNNTDAVNKALDDGADPNHKWGLLGKSALMHAVSDPSTQSEIYQALLDRGAMVSQSDSAGWNVCHWIASGSNDTLWLRLETMSKKSQAAQFAEAVKKKDAFGLNPLHVACHHAEDSDSLITTKFIQRMLKILNPKEPASPPPNSSPSFKRYDGWNTLHFACSKGSLEAVRTILSDKRVDLAFISQEANQPGYADAAGTAPKMTAFMLAAQHLMLDVDALEELDTQASLDRIPPQAAKAVLSEVLRKLQELGGAEGFRDQVDFLQQCAEGRAPLTLTNDAERSQAANEVVALYKDMCAGKSVAFTQSSRGSAEQSGAGGQPCSCLIA